MRRLTATQYTNSVRDLLGDDSSKGAALRQLDSIHGSQEIAAANAVFQTQDAKELSRGGQALAAALFADSARRSRLGICAPQAATDACIRSFFESFVPRAFRRPVSGVEIDALLQLTSKLALALGSAELGFQWAVGAILQSPHFVYRPEYGEPEPGRPDWWRFTAWEMASRLSFAFWDTTPDTELLEAARNGSLTDPAVVRTQAGRLLASERARSSVTHFLTDYFQVNRVDAVQRDTALFPDFGPELAQSMSHEAELLLGSFFFPGRDLKELFTSKKTFIDERLARFYGWSGAWPPAGSFVEVEFPAGALRGGLFSTAAWLAKHSAADHPSPMARGHAVRERFLCQELTIPANLAELIEAEQQRQLASGVGPPAADPTVTPARSASQTRLAAPTCGGCHKLMDPIGLAMENFDAIGRYRDAEKGIPIDATGELDGVSFSGIDGLQQVLERDPRVSRCIVQNTLAHLLGKDTIDTDAAVVETLTERFETAGRLLPSLLAEIVTSDGFRYTRPMGL